MKLSTHMMRPPMSVTAHSGILSRKLHPSMAVMISCGSTDMAFPPKPLEPMIVLMMPWTMLRNASISSKP